MRLAKKDRSPNSFLKLLQSTYLQCKEKIKENQELLNNVSLINKCRDRKQEKTRSKSRGKSSKMKSLTLGTVRCLRNNNLQGQQFEAQQIDKQPLWHINKRKQQSRQKIERVPKILKSTKSTKQKNPQKIKPSNPLYQFYSQQSNEINIEPTIQDTANHQIQNIVQNNQPNMEQPKQSIQTQLQNWNPTKKQISMLAIQNLIDEYVMFKHNLRNKSQLVRFVDLCRYVREIKGYYFNIEVLQSIIHINSNLYKLESINREKFIKCKRLTTLEVEQRQLQTKIKMMKNQ